MIYGIVGGQAIIAGMGAVIGLSIPAVKIAMDLYEVTDQRGCLEKVMVIFAEAQSLMKDENRKINKDAKRQGIPPPKG